MVRPLSRQAADIFNEALDVAGERERLFDVAERRAVSNCMDRCCTEAGLAGIEAHHGARLSQGGLELAGRPGRAPRRS